MDKIKIDLDIVLPDVPDEKDACVHRIISSMERKKGIEKAHIVPETETTKAQLCFHYDPEVISIEQVQKLAEQAGAAITERYGHLLIEVSGIRSLKDEKGILSVSVSPTGWIHVEFDQHETNPQKIYRHLKKLGLEVISPELKALAKPKHVHIPKKELHVEEEEHEEQVHLGIFGEKTELIFSIICGVLLAIGFGLSFVKSISSSVPVIFYCAAYFFGGFYTTKEAVEAISKGDFEIDFLMLVAAIGAAILGDWAEELCYFSYLV